ncbi:hypothetical protein [Nocardia africana]
MSKTMRNPDGFGRNSIMRVASIVATAVAFTVTLAIPTASAKPAEACDLGFPEETPTVVAPGIYAVVWADCTIPPDRHVMRVSLEKRGADGKWEAAPRVDAGGIDDPAIPNPRFTYRAEVLCSPGYWRITANASGNLKGIPFNFTDHSASRVVTAADCKV